MVDDVRKNKRTPVSLKVRFKSATLDEFIEQYCKDLSKGGVFVKSETPLPPGTLLKFEFQLRDTSPLIQGVGRVVWKREANEADDKLPAGMGIKFIKMDERSRSVVDRILAGQEKVEDKEAEAPGAEVPAEEPAEKAAVSAEPTAEPVPEPAAKPIPEPAAEPAAPPAAEEKPAEEKLNFTPPVLDVKSTVPGSMALHDALKKAMAKAREATEGIEKKAEALSAAAAPAGEAAPAPAEEKKPEEEKPAAPAEEKKPEEEKPAAPAEEKKAEEEKPAAPAEEKKAEEEKPAAPAEEKKAEEEKPAAPAEEKKAEEEKPAKAEEKKPEEEKPAKAEEKKPEEKKPTKAEEKKPEKKPEEKKPAKTEEKKADKKKAEEKKPAKAEEKKKPDDKKKAVGAPGKPSTKAVTAAKPAEEEKSNTGLIVGILVVAVILVIAYFSFTGRDGSDTGEPEHGDRTGVTSGPHGQDRTGPPDVAEQAEEAGSAAGSGDAGARDTGATEEVVHQISVTSEPEGATVLVNDSEQDGTTPLEVSGLTAGEQVTIVARHAGYKRDTKTLSVTEEPQTVSFKLLPLARRVVLTVPVKAQFFVKGARVAFDTSATIDDAELPLEVEVKAFRYEPLTVTVTEGDTTWIDNEEEGVTVYAPDVLALTKIAAPVAPGPGPVTAPRPGPGKAPRPGPGKAPRPGGELDPGSVPTPPPEPIEANPYE
jgi:uncharacterized protein (TIGR02266 family)